MKNILYTICWKRCFILLS